MTADSFVLPARRLVVAVAICLAITVSSAIRPAAATAATAATPNPITAWVISTYVLNLLNYERAVNHLPPLRTNVNLVRAAHAHNILMAKYDTLSHQLPGELSLGARVTKTTYTWRALAENAACTYDWSLAGALWLQRYMYNEKAPYNGHRLNILNPTYAEIGIDIYMDGLHHKMWLTEDFAHRI